MKTIFLEEAIRTMALIGIVIFGVAPLAILLGLDGGKTLLVMLPVPFLIFPVMVFLRWYTGLSLQIHSRRAWKWNGVGIVGVLFGLALLSALTLEVSFRQVVQWMIISTVMTALLVWLGIRFMSLR